MMLIKNLKVLFLILTILIYVGCANNTTASTNNIIAPSSTDTPVINTSDLSLSEMITEGEFIYETTCSGCHNDDATGLPNLGKSLVNTEFMDNISEDDLVSFIKIGRPSSDPENTTGIDMPPKGGDPSLSDEDIYNIIKYLQSLR